MICSGLCPINAPAGGGTARDARREGTDMMRGSVNNAAETDTQQAAILPGSPAELPDGAVLPAWCWVVRSAGSSSEASAWSTATPCSPDRQYTIAASSNDLDGEPARPPKAQATTGARRQTPYSAAKQAAEIMRRAPAGNDSILNSASDWRNLSLRLWFSIEDRGRLEKQNGDVRL
jgi:hypothetical protein